MLQAVSSTMLRTANRQLVPAAWHVVRTGYATATGTSGKVVELQSDDDYQTALRELGAGRGAAIIDFTAKWCGPCKMIAPVVDQLAAEFPEVRFYKVDIDNESVRQAVIENSVAAVPTFVGYKGADRVTAFSGADKAMLKRLALELSGHHVKTPYQ